MEGFTQNYIVFIVFAQQVSAFSIKEVHDLETALKCVKDEIAVT